jgi:thiamine biosynthesis lipoprotein
MKQTETIMGMPVTIEVIGSGGIPAANAIEDVFNFFRAVDKRYSTYKSDSEISKINAGLPKNRWSREMKQILDLCEQTKQETDGYFDIKRGDKLDPSGLVKGWAIDRAAKRLRRSGFDNFCLEAGGDFQTGGLNPTGGKWRIGIRNPFARAEIIKVLAVSGAGIATSGTAVRGQHIYDPHKPAEPIEEVKSLTVVGPNIYEADRFATAAFAMGRRSISFIDSLDGFEGYMVDADKKATFTAGFGKYLA